MRRKKMMGMTEEECMKEFDRISADCPKMQFNLDVVLATQYLWAELLLEGLDIEYASVIKARIIHIRNQLRLFERQAVPDTNIEGWYRAWDRLLDVMQAQIEDSEEEASEQKEEKMNAT
jgi:hypothetical protein